MKRLALVLLCAVPFFAFADPAGEVELKRLMVGMGHPIGHRSCGAPGEEKDTIVEYRPIRGKKASEIFTKSGHYVVIEAPNAQGIPSRYYFSGVHVPRGDKLAFDAKRHHDPKKWAALLQSPEIVKFYFSPKEKNTCGALHLMSPQ